MVEASKDEQEQKIRILAVDDDRTILDMYQYILAPKSGKGHVFAELEDISARLFGKVVPKTFRLKQVFEVDNCRQGNEAVEMVQHAIAENRPYTVIFLDVRMPPGPDGITTAEAIRKLDPLVNIVIVTAFSDVHPDEIAERLRSPHNLFYIQKPFHHLEIYQFASTLSNNFFMQKELVELYGALEERVELRTAELHQANELLKTEIMKRRKLASEIQDRNKDLEEINTAMSVLLSKREADKYELEERVVYNTKELIVSYLNQLKQTELTTRQKTLLEILESNLNDIVSPFVRRLSLQFSNLTPSEMQIANLIKQGRSSKEIAELMHLSRRTIESHRKNIRKKLVLTNKKENLRTHLMALQ